MSEIDVMELKQKFQQVQNPKTGKAYGKLYFNKGL